MSIKLQDIPSSTNLDLTDKFLVSDGTSEHLVTAETLLGHMNVMFQGTTSGSQTIPGDAYMYKKALITNGVEVPAGGSGMEISSGGIKVSATGSYRITASLYLSTNANPNGVYVFYGTSFTDGPGGSTGATELCGIYTDAPKASLKQVIGVVQDVPANTIFWIVARSSTTSSTASNGFLLVERLS